MISQQTLYKQYMYSAKGLAIVVLVAMCQGYFPFFFASSSFDMQNNQIYSPGHWLFSLTKDIIAQAFNDHDPLIRPHHLYM